jgi:glycosyltransferase involved in cell wall biosynthesis
MTFEKLDIIIPQYKETEEMIKPLLTSIENQVGVKNTAFTVTIVNDHSDCKLSQEFLNSFSYPIQYLETPENGGGGMTRQYGVDHTSNPLIMFCDADDRLFDCAALLNLFNAIRINKTQTGVDFNMLSSSFYEEHISADGKGYDLIKHEKPTMI